MSQHLISQYTPQTADRAAQEIITFWGNPAECSFHGLETGPSQAAHKWITTFPFSVENGAPAQLLIALVKDQHNL